MDILERVLGRCLRARKPKEPEVYKHITLLYVTPEQVQTNRFREVLAELHRKRRLALFAVDEAHW
jgi:superfamily II DNA helicase RecQ